MAVLDKNLARAAFIAVALISFAAWVVAGLYGIAGEILAFVLAWVSVTSLKIFATSLLPTESRLPKTTNLTAIVLLLKLPAVLILVYLATRLTQAGLCCFLGTLSLVYSAIVWRLATSAN